MLKAASIYPDPKTLWNNEVLFNVIAVAMCGRYGYNFYIADKAVWIYSVCMFVVGVGGEDNLKYASSGSIPLRFWDRISHSSTGVGLAK